MLVASVVGVLAHKHEPVVLQSAVVVANRVAFLSFVGGTYPGKSLCGSDLGGGAIEGIWFASIPSLAVGSASPALRLPIKAAAVG